MLTIIGLVLTIIGIPGAFWLFNRIPQAMTLRQRTVDYQVEMLCN